MRQEALVDRKEALRPDRFGQTVEDAVVKVAILVVETRHDRVYGLWLGTKICEVEEPM